MSSFYVKDNSIDLRELMMEDIVPNYKPERNIKQTSSTTSTISSGNIDTNSIISSVNAIIESNKPSITKPPKEFIEQYVMLDSYVKVKNSSTEYGEFKWTFNTQGQTLDEAVGIIGTLDNVVQIQIGTFYIPIIEDSVYMDKRVESYGTVSLIQNNTSAAGLPPTLIRQDGNYGQYTYSILFDGETYKFPWTNNPFSQIPFANKISIQIKEASLQSYAGFNNIRYNYEFLAMHNNRINGNPNFVQVKPINGARWDEFNFNTPLKDLNTITLVFRNPDYPISFEPDVMYRSFISLVVDPTPPAGSFLIITTQFVHKLCAGDRIYLKNFVPALPNGSTNTLFPDYLLQYIHRQDGHTANSVVPGIGLTLDPARPILTPTDFGLDPSIKLLNPIDPNITVSLPGLVDVYIAKRRIRIPLKIKSIKNSNNKDEDTR
jgi:hypothetical protein